MGRDSPARSGRTATGIGMPMVGREQRGFPRWAESSGVPTVGRVPRGPHGSMNSPLHLVVVDTGSGGEDSARLPIFLVATALARALSSKGIPSPVIGAGAQRAYTFPGLGTLPPKMYVCMYVIVDLKAGQADC